MIPIIKKTNYTIRANGWVQDASNIENLLSFVKIFYNKSPGFDKLLQKIEKIILPEDGKNKFLELLRQKEIILTYRDIVGSSFTPRSSARCNGIGQASLNGQKREFQSDWPTDNFLRWSVILQFIEHDQFTDTYKITKEGIKFVCSKDKNEMIENFKNQLLYYSPVKRILELLSKEDCSKFSLGQKLGCIGEKGFTSIKEKFFLDKWFFSNSEDRKKVMSDFEGSSDKYARQICSWLSKCNLITSYKKDIKIYSETVKLTYYKISLEGKLFLRKINTINKFFVPFGMLSMSIKNSELHKKRRALILKYAIENHCLSISNLLQKLKEQNIESYKSEIEDDVYSMIACGLNIKIEDSIISCDDTIVGLSIPDKIHITKEKEIEQIKHYLRQNLKKLNHKYLNMVDYAFGGKTESRLFEVYTAEVYSEIFPNTKLLGGTNKPDVLTNFDEMGIIIDAKAYSNGFKMPVAEADKMIRYINEANTKREDINPNKWWENFPLCVKNYSFQYVSSKFSSNINEKVEILSLRSKTNGSVINVKNLLLLIDNVISGELVEKNIFISNNEIQVE